jgi:hypothetical protein
MTRPGRKAEKPHLPGHFFYTRPLHAGLNIKIGRNDLALPHISKAVTTLKSRLGILRPTAGE